MKDIIQVSESDDDIFCSYVRRRDTDVDGKRKCDCCERILPISFFGVSKETLEECPDMDTTCQVCAVG